MGGYCHADEAKPDVKVPKEGHEVEAQRTKDPRQPHDMATAPLRFQTRSGVP
jgi:hypothetical protein